MDKPAAVHSHNGMLLCKQKDTGNNMDGSQRHDSIYRTLWQRLECKDRKQISGCQGLGEGLEVDAKGMEEFSGMMQ